MKDQILYSTQNIVKYINVNTLDLITILISFSEKHLKKENNEKAGKHILNDLIKTLINIETFMLENKMKQFYKLDGKLILSYRTFKYIYENMSLETSIKKIIKNILIYLYCIIKLIKNKNGYDFSENNESIKNPINLSDESIKVSNSSDCHFTVSDNSESKSESKENTVYSSNSETVILPKKSNKSSTKSIELKYSQSNISNESESNITKSSNNTCDSSNSTESNTCDSSNSNSSYNTSSKSIVSKLSADLESFGQSLKNKLSQIKYSNKCFTKSKIDSESMSKSSTCSNSTTNCSNNSTTNCNNSRTNYDTDSDFSDSCSNGSEFSNSSECSDTDTDCSESTNSVSTVYNRKQYCNSESSNLTTSIVSCNKTSVDSRSDTESSRCIRSSSTMTRDCSGSTIPSFSDSTECPSSKSTCTTESSNSTTKCSTTDYTLSTNSCSKSDFTESCKNNSCSLFSSSTRQNLCDSSSKSGSCFTDNTSCCDIVESNCNTFKVCKDKKIIEYLCKLKSLYDMHNLLKTITLMLENQYIDQLNVANEYSPNQKIHEVDYDMNTKIMDMYYSQFHNAIKNYCNLLDSNKGKQIEIKCHQKNKKEYIFCVISNIKICLNKNKEIIIIIGNEKRCLEYISLNYNYKKISEIYKNNIENIEILIKCIHNNQQLLFDNICTTQELLKYNI